MANVKSLIEFYNNQNALATRVSEATAANQTSANIESARLGAEAKRLDQEKQLEFFRQKMEDLRNKRATGSAEQIAANDITARQQAAALSQGFSESSNAAERDFRLKLQSMQQEGDQARQNQLIASNKDIANIGAVETMMTQQRKEELAAPQAAADLEKTKQATRADLIKQLQEAEKLPTEYYDVFGASNSDKAKFKDRIVNSIKAELTAMGENSDMIPEVIAAKAPQVAAKAKALASSIDNDFTQFAQDGRIQRATKLISDYQEKLMSGTVTSAAGKRAMDTYLTNKLNSLGITSADIAKIKKSYGQE
jgi:hypothetical protein